MRRMVVAAWIWWKGEASQAKIKGLELGRLTWLREATLKKTQGVFGQLGIAQIVIAPPTPHSNGHSSVSFSNHSGKSSDPLKKQHQKVADRSIQSDIGCICIFKMLTWKDMHLFDFSPLCVRDMFPIKKN